VRQPRASAEIRFSSVSTAKTAHCFAVFLVLVPSRFIAIKSYYGTSQLYDTSCTMLRPPLAPLAAITVPLLWLGHQSGALRIPQASCTRVSKTRTARKQDHLLCPGDTPLRACCASQHRAHARPERIVAAAVARVHVARALHGGQRDGPCASRQAYVLVDPEPRPEGRATC
jgi:hypothetical protein